MKRYSCPRCQNRKFYSVRRGKKRCKKCLYEWKPKLAGLRLKRGQWKKILFWFLLGHSIKTICQQTGISHYSVEKAVATTRRIVTKDVPGIFSGTVEVDETYLGGQKKNKRKSQLKKEAQSRRGFGTTKQPVFGILTRQGKVFAKLAEDTEAVDLLPVITKKVKTGSRICSDTWRAYTGLAAKGGVRRKYLSFFLGEYVWRYNYRNMKIEKQVDRLLKKITDFSG